MIRRKEFDEKQVAELKAARAKNKNKNVERRLLAVLLYAQGVERAQIVLRTGYKRENYITDLAAKYRSGGLEALTVNHYKGNNRNMSFEEEAKLLDSFKNEAEAGQVVEVKKIKAAYMKKVGRETRSKGQIYEVLKRHGWRKVMPRGKHPKQADEATVEASKKLTQW